MAKQRSARRWASIIRSYRGSGLTQVEFCGRRGLALSTLTYHLRKERPQFDTEGEAGPQLLELSVSARPANHLDWRSAIESVLIEVPTGQGETLRIHCQCRQTGEVLRQIPGLSRP
jgi:hypothetical protein